MICSSKILATSVLLVCGAVLLATVASSAFGQKANSSSQIRKSKKAKSKIKMSEPLTGDWSGKHITLKITEQGAEVEYDCAKGAVNQKIILDKNNRFNIGGSFTEEHGGPVRANEQPKNVAVKYSGQVNGKKMMLVVTRADDGAVIGNFTLLRGQESLLVKCRQLCNRQIQNFF